MLSIAKQLMQPVLQQLQRDLKKVIQKLPRQFGAEVVLYTMQNFRTQSWQGDTWKRRKSDNGVNRKGKGRAILVKSGRLKRSIRVTEASATRVVIGSDVPYAQIHNEGFNGPQSVKGFTRNVTRRKLTKMYHEDTGAAEHVRIKYNSEEKVKAFVRRMKMPRRQFLGDSPYLRRNLTRIATAEFNRTLKPYMRTNGFS
jgi:phage gpG-like protein